MKKVNAIWAGLGYYSRAARLLEGAKMVVKKYNGILPSNPSELIKIPGIGRYTAGAIASQAFGIKAELVDGNVMRVLARIRGIGSDVKVKATVDLFWKLAKEIVDDERPGDFNQALMELGATLCTPNHPKCNECPLSWACRARAEVCAQKDNALDIESLPHSVTCYPAKKFKKSLKEQGI